MPTAAVYNIKEHNCKVISSLKYMPVGYENVFLSIYSLVAFLPLGRQWNIPPDTLIHKIRFSTTYSIFDILVHILVTWLKLPNSTIFFNNVKSEVFRPVDTDTMVSCDMMCYIPVHKYEHPGENRNFLLQSKRLNTKATGSSETSVSIYSVS